MTIQEALEAYGGTVKFFGTNEPLEDMADFIKPRSFRNVLACSAGGDQCLTIMGALPTVENFYAFDNNPAQLFILAYKAKIIQDGLEEFNLCLEKICAVYENQVSALQLSPVEITKIMNRKTHQISPLPDAFMKEYVSVLANTDFIEKPVYWRNDAQFLSAIRKNLEKLQFVCADLLLIADGFTSSYFDLIYLSDIFTPSLISKHWIKRLKLLLDRLVPGGVVFGYQEFAYEKTIIGFMRQNAGLLGLKELCTRNGMIVLEKLG